MALFGHLTDDSNARNAKPARPKHGSAQRSNIGLHTPPSSQSQAEMDARSMLISPPPEELLERNRTASIRARSISSQSGDQTIKRKRQTSVASISIPVAEATPNSKPRKQSKRHVDFVARASSPLRASSSNNAPRTPTHERRSRTESPTKRDVIPSPHHTNPSADFILPSSSHRRAPRRSTTPLFPYEPPAERFTPPREVVCESPTRPRTNGRKSVNRRLTITVKKEPPVIDLSRPLPPPSPTDDPLLLSGPPRRRKARVRAPQRVASPDPFDYTFDVSAHGSVRSLSGSAHSHSRDTPPLSSSPPRDYDVPFPELMMQPPTAHAELSLDFSDADDSAPAFGFNVLDAANDAWSDDDVQDEHGLAEEGFGEGEYTGRYREVMVPIMADPPSSCTRMRMDAWGRPKSPHPRLAVLREGLVEEEEEEGEGGMVRLEEEEDCDRGEMPEEEQSLEGDGEKGNVAALAEQDDGGGEGPLDESVLPDENGETEDVEERVAITLGVEDSVEARYVPEQEEATAGDASSSGLFRCEDSLTPPSLSEEERADFAETSNSSGEPGLVAYEECVTPSYVDSRTPSSSPVELRAAPAYYDYDVLMDDSSDQDTLTEPDLEDNFARLHSEEQDIAPLKLASTSTTEPFRAQTDQEDDSYATSCPTPVHVQELGSSLEDEEDLWDEATVDRELSVVPSAGSDDEDEIEGMPSFNLPGPDPMSLHLDVEHGYDDLSDSSDESEPLDAGVIKITSDDPLAAARAAAILRLHDYDCLPHVPAKKRRRSLLDASSVMRDARRRSSLASGIRKAAASTPHQSRRHTLGGMLGDKVVIPGSPALTISELLDEAQRSLNLVDKSAALDAPWTAAAFVTPSKPVGSFSWATPDLSSSFASVCGGEGDPGVWTRKQWKKLDSCLTDERLALGRGSGLADVDAVDLEKVVDRFFDMLQEPATAVEWSREDVLRRARALQKKQQRGKIAPPTPSAASIFPCTPVAPPARKGDAVAAESRSSSTSTGQQQPQSQKSSNSGIPRSTLATRVKGFIFSYLPGSTPKAQPAKKPQPAKPGLPLPIPPPETFAKPRGPIHTPAPKSIAKPVPPKNTVNLNNVPPPKPSRIPRSKEPPRRLVELNPLPRPPSEKSLLVDPANSRRDSGGSVKDLIMAFEGLRESQSGPPPVASQRSKLKERPIWR